MFDLFGRITGQVRKALQDFNMVRPGDRLVVGLSGGKDSLTLLTALADLRRYYPAPFELEAITVDLGFNDLCIEEDIDDGIINSANGGECIDNVGNVDSASKTDNATAFASLSAYCERLNVKHTVIPTHIGKIVFEYKKDENPCSICANMRRGALNNAAVASGCNKVVLAHNRDDVIETMLLSLLYEGRISTFSPVTYLDEKRLHVLRPLLFTEEKYIASYTKQASFSIVENPCPANGKTQRQFVKDLLSDLSKTNRHIKSNIFGAIKRDIFQ